MSHTYKSTRRHAQDRAVSHALPNVERFLRLTFVYGPKQLLTSRISRKCAGIMAALCAPSLLCCSLLTLPAFLFQSPEQHAYYYFSRIINEDPARWFVMLLATGCAILSLAIPAIMPAPRATAGY